MDAFIDLRDDIEHPENVAEGGGCRHNKATVIGVFTLRPLLFFLVTTRPNSPSETMPNRIGSLDQKISDPLEEAAKCTVRLACTAPMPADPEPFVTRARTMHSEAGTV
jgi:hypothetical protein